AVTTFAEAVVVKGTPDRVLAFALSPDADRLLVARRDVDLWNLRQKERRVLHARKRAYSVAWVPGARPRALAGGESGWLALIDLDEGASDSLAPHSDSVLSVSVAADGRLAASSSLDGHVRLWDLS